MPKGSLDRRQPCYLQSTMITSAITAAIVAVLGFLGIPPGPYVAGVWIGVKVVIVASMALFGWRMVRKRAKANLSKPADPVP